MVLRWEITGTPRESVRHSGTEAEDAEETGGQEHRARHARNV